MAEVTESTKVAVKLGTGFVIAMTLLGAGRYWGVFETQRATTELRLERNEKDIGELRSTFGAMQKTLMEIQSEQNTNSKLIETTAKNTNAMMFDWGNLKVAMAEKGIIVKGD